MVAFGVTALALVVLAFAVAWAVGSAREGLVARLEGGAPTVKRWGGALLLVVGAWMLALGMFAEAFAGVFPV